MKKAIILIFFAIMLCGCSEKSDSSQSLSSVDIFAMDTYMNLKAYGENAQTALNQASDEITRLEKELSVTDEDSDIYKINSLKSATEIGNDTVNIINTAIEIGNQTDGALDITIYPVLKEWGFTSGEYKIPSQSQIDELLKNVDFRKIDVSENTVTIPENSEIDLGALAKGYTSDKIVEIMKENGVTSAVINLGGNVHTIGTKPDGSLWKVAIQNPFSDGQIGVLSISDKAVITSGNYERYFTGEDGKNYWHIIDANDGYPADNGLVSVTIIGDSGITCDALSTALFVMGTDKAIEYWQQNKTFDMILVTDNAEIYVTESIQDNFTSDLQFEIIS